MLMHFESFVNFVKERAATDKTWKLWSNFVLVDCFLELLIGTSDNIVYIKWHCFLLLWRTVLPEASSQSHSRFTQVKSLSASKVGGLLSKSWMGFVMLLHWMKHTRYALIEIWKLLLLDHHYLISRKPTTVFLLNQSTETVAVSALFRFLHSSWARQHWDFGQYKGCSVLGWKHWDYAVKYVNT